MADMPTHDKLDQAKGHLRAAAMPVSDFGNPNIVVVRLDEALAILNSLAPSAVAESKAWPEMSPLERAAFNAGVQSVSSSARPTEALVHEISHKLRAWHTGQGNLYGLLNEAANALDEVQKDSNYRYQKYQEEFQRAEDWIGRYNAMGSLVDQQRERAEKAEAVASAIRPPERLLLEKARVWWKTWRMDFDDDPSWKALVAQIDECLKPGQDATEGAAKSG